MTEEASVIHPPRACFSDLLQKNLRGVGGDKAFLDIGGKVWPWAIFGNQIKSHLHRQRLISDHAKAFDVTSCQLVALRAVLTLVYLARLMEVSGLFLVPDRDVLKQTWTGSFHLRDQSGVVRSSGIEVRSKIRRAGRRGIAPHRAPHQHYAHNRSASAPSCADKR
jgi:hypothetical protein